MSQQSVSLMDIFTTVLNLANIEPPSDRIIDGINLVPVLLENKNIDRYVCADPEPDPGDLRIISTILYYALF